MKLVYLWVEEYKNIIKEGFNFSSRFECSYDGESLTICDKKNDKCGNNDYIENFFGKNINITAIVGENGSGKSNILEVILCIVYENSVPFDKYKLSAIFYDERTNDYYEKSINFSILNNISLGNIIKRVDSVFAFHYNYSLDYIENKENNINFNKLYHKKDNYKKPILLQPNKSNYNINIKLMDFLANQDMLNFIIHKNMSFKNIKSFFEVEKCKLDFDYSYIYGKNEKENLLFSYMKKLSLDFQLNIFTHSVNYGLEDYLSKFEYITRDGLILLTQFYILKKAIKNKEVIIDGELKESILNFKYAEALEFIKTKSFKKLFSSDFPYQTYKIKQSFSFIEFLEAQKEKYTLSDDYVDIIKHKELLLNLAPWINIEFFNSGNISFNDLSYGQKFLIKFLYSLLNQLNNLSTHREYSDLILLLDEVEMGLHPQWQKEFISLLIDVLKKFNSRFNFNIITTSHSPFLLSDIPKEDIIFLKNGKKVDVEIDTFGANIHTLLSHGFFMDEGLMGEFAKDKINDIIQNLKNSNYNPSQEEKEKVLYTIKQIGEEFLRKKLLDMYYKKFDDDFIKKQRKEELKKLQEKIAKELKSL